MLNQPPDFLVVSSWLWDKFGSEFIKNILKPLKGVLSKEWDKFEWVKAAKIYREKVYELNSTIRVLGNPIPISLEGIYTEVHILDKPTANQRGDFEQLKNQYSSRDYIQEIHKGIDAIDFIHQNDRTFILGKPGAGKTTLLRHLTLLSAKGEIDKVPIFISLNDWSQRSQGLLTQHDLISYIVSQFEICSFPDAQLFIEEELLKKGRAIILFDGLDEVNNIDNNMQFQIIRIIEDFSDQYSRNTFVITCRIAATEYEFQHFKYVEIADFDPKQIITFVQKWFGGNTEIGSRFIKDINLPQNSGLYELARTPILLNLLCINFEETLTFPSRRNEIYQEAIDALLKKWDSSRNIKRDEIYHGLSLSRKRQLFSLIASVFFKSASILFVTVDVARCIESFLTTLPINDNYLLDGVTILRALEAQHGLIIERARGIHSFSHLSIQEYFVAQDIIENNSETNLNQLVTNFYDPRWHEIFLLISGSLPSADTFLLRLLKTQRLFRQRNPGFKAVYLTFDSLRLNSIQRMAIYGMVFKYNITDKTINLLDQSLIEISGLLSIKETNVDYFGEIKLLCHHIHINFEHYVSLPTTFPNIYYLVSDLSLLLDRNGEISSWLEKASKLNEYINQINRKLGDFESRKLISADPINSRISQEEINNYIIDIKSDLQLASDLASNINSGFSNCFTETDLLSVFKAIPQEYFKNYFYMRKLFVECLGVAAVKRREFFIENAL